MIKNTNQYLFFQPHLSTIKYKTITGSLNPIKWNKQGKAIGFSIFTSEDEDIIIESYSDLKRLRKYSGYFVKVQGRIRINDFGDKSIKLFKIRKVKMNKDLNKNLFIDDFYLEVS